jgi:glycerol-3-phosphate dehydrogenase (NAD(P)+)
MHEVTSFEKAAVLGSGSWGTALASVLSVHCKKVALWGRDPNHMHAIATERENKKYLPGLPLPANISAETDSAVAVADAQLIVCATPTKALRETFAPLAHKIKEQTPVVSASKGICTETLLFPTQMIQSALGRAKPDHLFILSGPSFAQETMRRLPTAVALAGRDPILVDNVSRAFFTPFFRTYPSLDPVGVEVAGALKNVIAVAAGISEGLGLGNNGLAALITRGLAEITRFGVAYGAEPMTFLGLAGMGDLVLTCTGSLSRNRQLGMHLAKGKALEESLKAIGQVAEGVHTTQSVHKILENRMVNEMIDMPILSEVYNILFAQKPAPQALKDLMTRPMRTEHGS